MTHIKPSTVDDYISGLPPVAREKILELRGILKEVAPEAEEELKWGKPVLVGRRILFSFSASQKHITFMPTRPCLLPFMEELTDFKTGKDTIQFSFDKQLPGKLIRKIAEYRLNDVNENDAKWMY